jgi:hypothetical protein
VVILPWILQIANPKKNNRVDTIPTRKSSRIASLNSESDFAKLKVSIYLECVIRCDNPFVMLALEQMQAAFADDKSPTVGYNLGK